MKQKLNAKDFILIGILTALMWIICMIISTIMSVAGPVTNVFYPSVVAIPNGIVMMLLLAKVPKKGVFTICAAIQAILFLLVGAFWFIPIGLVIGGVICDFLIMGRNEITMKSMMAAYALFSAIFAFSAICPIKFLQSAFVGAMEKNNIAPEYIQGMLNITSVPMKVYIFDEPSANLDYAATKRLAEIMEKLKSAGYTIFVVEHRFYYLRDLIDRAFLIQNGKIEHEFTREQFCSLPEETRISYGLRTAYPERDAEHYQEKSHSQNTTHLLEVHDLGFAYKKGPDVFRNVSFEAHSGDVIGILGHNGAGKTTLLSILTGLLKQRHGEVRLDGKKLTPRQRRSLSYLVMQDTDYQLFASSVEEELSLGMQEDCKEKIDAVLNALELSDYRERHPASLSGGQKQRVTIGVAIVKDSPVIYFDEPTSGLDYDSMVRVSKLIEQLSDSGVIVFVVSHDFEFIVRTCTEVVQLDDDGTIQNQQLSPTVLKSLSEKYFT